MVIFDEAHNLESVASEAASFELTSAQVAGAQDEALRCHRLFEEGLVSIGMDQVWGAVPEARRDTFFRVSRFGVNEIGE